MLDAAGKLRLDEIKEKTRLYHETALKEMLAVKEKHEASVLPHARMALRIVFGATIPEMMLHVAGIKLGLLERMAVGDALDKPIGDLFTAEERAKMMEEGTPIADVMGRIASEGRVAKGFKAGEKLDIGIGVTEKVTPIPGGELHHIHFESTDQLREFLAKKFDLKPSEVEEMIAKFVD